LEKDNESYWIPFDLAEINSIQNNKVEACRWLERAINAGWRDYRSAEIDPLLENIRSEDRFNQMLADVKAKVEEMRRHVEEMEKE
jgi:hypothetical protein